MTKYAADLEGSTGLKVIHQRHPHVFVSSGIMERGNFSAAAGFGFDADKFGGHLVGLKAVFPVLTNISRRF